MATIHYSGPSKLNLIYNGLQYDAFSIKDSRLISKLYQADQSKNKINTVLKINNWDGRYLFNNRSDPAINVKFTKGWNLTEIVGQVLNCRSGTNLIYIPKLIKLKTSSVGLWFIAKRSWYPRADYKVKFNLRIGVWYDTVIK